MEGWGMSGLMLQMEVDGRPVWQGKVGGGADQVQGMGWAGDAMTRAQCPTHPDKRAVRMWRNGREVNLS